MRVVVLMTVYGATARGKARCRGCRAERPSLADDAAEGAKDRLGTRPTPCDIATMLRFLGFLGPARPLPCERLPARWAGRFCFCAFTMLKRVKDVCVCVQVCGCKTRCWA